MLMGSIVAIRTSQSPKKLSLPEISDTVSLSTHGKAAMLCMQSKPAFATQAISH